MEDSANRVRDRDICDSVHSMALARVSRDRRLEIEDKQDAELKKQLDKITWPIEYGVISIQLRAGKPTLIKVERTIKLD